MNTNAQNSAPEHKLIIGESNKGRIIKASEIIYLEADNNYCRVYLIGDHEIVVCKTLKSYEDTLNPNIFFRCHKSYLVNILYIREYQTRKNEFLLILQNNTVIEVARRRVSDLKRFLQNQFLE